MNNLILSSDSYKAVHHNQYLPGTEKVYSYFESRNGATFKYTTFFGLQYLLKKYLVGPVVSAANVLEAEELFASHFGTNKYFNREGWMHIVREHGGHLPVSIKAVPEGECVSTSNVLMTIENTDPKCFWLTNYLETLLSQVWYPCTVATLSRNIKEICKYHLDKTAESSAGLPFMLHDFGYRGVSSQESAGIGGAAHLVNFSGTDTIAGIRLARKYYGATPNVGLSVAATEHSVMTAGGRDGEEMVVERLLNEYPTGILSVVGDSYDIGNFVENIIGKKFKQRILNRDGVFVVRPDSCKRPDTPEAQTLWIVRQLAKDFGAERNKRGYYVLNPKVRVIWGDGIDIIGISKILTNLTENGFSAENVVFGMGGHLLQSHSRDTQRFAFKCSWQQRNGQGYDIFKDPKDSSKASKKGRLKLVQPIKNSFVTISESQIMDAPTASIASGDELVDVFRDGKLLVDQTFDEIRKRASC